MEFYSKYTKITFFFSESTADDSIHLPKKKYKEEINRQNGAANVIYTRLMFSTKW